jgi:hypothetical protein
VCSLQRTGGWGAGATPWQAGKLGQHQLKRTRDAEGHGGEGKAERRGAVLQRKARRRVTLRPDHSRGFPYTPSWTWAPGRSGARAKGNCCFKAYLCRQSSDLVRKRTPLFTTGGHVHGRRQNGKCQEDEVSQAPALHGERAQLEQVHILPSCLHARPPSVPPGARGPEAAWAHVSILGGRPGRPHMASAEPAAVPFFYFLAVVGFDLRASRLLGRRSTT